MQWGTSFKNHLSLTTEAAKDIAKFAKAHAYNFGKLLNVAIFFFCAPGE